MAVTIREFITAWGFKVDFGTLKQMDARLGQLQKQTGQVGANFKRLGRSARAAGSQMTARLSLPIIGLGAAAAKMSGSFDASFAKIIGLVGVAEDEVAGMRDRVLELAGETARAPQELAEAMFFVTSAGLRGADALDVLEASARASAAGLGDTAVIADLVTSAVNAYGPAVLNAGQATDILVAAVREGKAEAPDLAASLGQVLPIASQMGVTFDQVGAAVAGMTRTGTKATTAAVQLRQILNSLIKPGNQSKEALASVGLSANGIRRQIRERGLLSALATLKNSFEGNDEATAQVFGNIRALSGVLDLLGGNAEDNIAIFDRMTDATGSLDNAFAAASKTSDFEYKQALADVKVAMIDLGKAATPFFRAFAKAVRRVAKAFSAMSPEAKNALVVIGGIVAAVGPLLILFGLLATSVVAMAQALKVLKTGFLAVKSAITFVRVAAALGNTSMLAFIGSMLAAIAIPALLAAAIVLLVDEIIGMFTGKRTFFGDVVGDWVWKNITLPVIKGIETMVENVKKVPSRVKSGLKKAFGTAAKLFGFGDSTASIDATTGISPGTSPAGGPAGGAGGGSIVTSGDTNVAVTVPQGTSAQDAKAVADEVGAAVRKEMERRDRHLLASFPEVD